MLAEDSYAVGDCYGYTPDKESSFSGMKTLECIWSWGLANLYSVACTSPLLTDRIKNKINWRNCQFVYSRSLLSENDFSLFEERIFTRKIGSYFPALCRVSMTRWYEDGRIMLDVGSCSFSRPFIENAPINQELLS